ncbi:MAG: choice-of-anchor P family protein, partial [Acidimicrobiales bacterium]
MKTKRFIVRTSGAMAAAAIITFLPSADAQAALSPQAPGTISTVVGNGTYGVSPDGTPAAQASLAMFDQTGMAADGAGDLFVVDSEANVVQEVPVADGAHYGIAMQADRTYTVAGTGTYGYSGDGGSAQAAQMKIPIDVAVDGQGNLFIADSRNDVVREVVAQSGTYFGQTMVAGDIYTVLVGSSQPTGVAVDGAGNLYASMGQAVEEVAVSNGSVATVAGTGSYGTPVEGVPATTSAVRSPGRLAVDGTGDLFISDDVTNDYAAIQEVPTTSGLHYGIQMTAGDIYTVAGGNYGSGGDCGPATAAGMESPDGLAVDAAGDLFVSDEINQVVSEVLPSGILEPLAGNGAFGFSGDGGPAVAARLFDPGGAAVDASGDIFVADTGNDRIRRMVPLGVVSGRSEAFALVAQPAAGPSLGPVSDASASSGQQQSVSLASYSVPGVAAISLADDQAAGGSGTVCSFTPGRASANLSDVSLLGGLITARTADAEVVAGLGGPSAAGSSFAGLVVDGRAVPDQVAPNTVVVLPGGLGQVTLNEQSPSALGLRVTMIDVHL